MSVESLFLTFTDLGNGQPVYLPGSAVLFASIKPNWVDGAANGSVIRPRGFTESYIVSENYTTVLETAAAYAGKYGTGDGVGAGV